MCVCMSAHMHNTFLCYLPVKNFYDVSSTIFLVLVSFVTKRNALAFMLKVVFLADSAYMKISDMLFSSSIAPQVYCYFAFRGIMNRKS